MSRGMSLGVLKSAARAGNSEAQYALGSCYRIGNGVEADLVVARQWLLRAAEQGCPDAQNDIASLLVNGMGGPKDAPIATIWYERAAVQGHAEAQFNLALRFLHGDGVTEDPATAAMWLWRATEQDHVEATCELGTLFRFGRGVHQSYKKAGVLHLQAAKGGDPVAYGNLCDYHQEIAAIALAGDLQSALVMSEIYATGIGVDKDPIEGMAWALLVGTPELPFQEEDEAARQPHRVLLSTLESELGKEEHSASVSRCGELQNRCLIARSESTPSGDRIGDSV